MVKIRGSIKLDNQAGDPVAPVEGQLYYNSTDKELKVFNGIGWV